MGSSFVPSTISGDRVLMVSRNGTYPKPQEQEITGRVRCRTSCANKMTAVLDCRRSCNELDFDSDRLLRVLRRFRQHPTMHIQRSNGVQRALLTVVLMVMVALTSCHRSPRLPGKNSKTYADMVSAFYIGLA